MITESDGILKRTFLRAVKSREMGVFAALVTLIVIVSILRYDAFLTGTNLFNVTRQIAFTAIVAIGVLFVILTGGIDLSLGSTVGLTGFLCGVALYMWGLPPALAVLVGVLTGVLVGAINGTIVAYVGVTPFIVTLAMLTAGRSVIYLLFDGKNIIDIPEIFSTVGNGAVLFPWVSVGGGLHFVWLEIPIPFVMFMGVALVSHVVLKYSTFGRRIYAIGGNEEATRLSGINVRAVKFFAYIVCSVLCSVTGLLYIGRFRSAVANAGVGLELDAIAAAVIGGWAMMGGSGSVLGVIIGACIMGVVNDAITLLGVKSEAQGLIIGFIIVAAAILDVMRSRKTAPSTRTSAMVLSLVAVAVFLGYLARAWYVLSMAVSPEIKSRIFVNMVSIGAAIPIVILGLILSFKKPRSAAWVLLLAAALLAMELFVILGIDFFHGRTILEAERINTLLLIISIGCAAALAHASWKHLRKLSAATRGA